MTDAPKVYEAICNVMRDIGTEGISKNRNNQQQGYKFRGIDDVYNALSAVLSKNALVILPRVLEHNQVERQTVKGNPLFYTFLKVEFKAVCSLDGSSETIVTVGEAMDSGDKSSNKAMSAAYKYACMQMFCIPTEGDNDADATTHEVAPMTPRNANGTPAQPLKRDEARKLFTDLKTELYKCDSDAAVMAFEHDYAAKIALLGDWKTHIDNEIAGHRQFLAEQKGKAA